MAQNKSFDPPVSSPPDEPPRTILQVETNRPSSDWGAIPRIMPKPEGGVPLQRQIAGRSEGPSR
jgi:hypothetical protein